MTTLILASLERIEGELAAIRSALAAQHASVVLLEHRIGAVERKRRLFTNATVALITGLLLTLVAALASGRV